MPLRNTQSELDNTVLVLSRLLNQPTQLQEVADRLAKKSIRQLILVGSGDSLSIALLTAHYMEQRLGFPCRAYQSYEFIQNAGTWLTAEDVVIAISASGRSSPIVDALKLAVSSPAMTVGLTNQTGTEFSQLPEKILCTNAVKTGIPTQSSTAALLCLMLLTIEWRYRCGMVDGRTYQSDKDSLGIIISLLSVAQKQFRERWQQYDRSLFFNRPVTFIDSGGFTGIASLGVNLLACGPQLLTQAYWLEEYHHSLRLSITRPEQLFILFVPESSSSTLIQDTYAQLSRIGAKCLFVSSSYYADILKIDKRNISRSHMIFLHILFLQELALQLAKDFVAQGGTRATIPTGEL